LDEDGVYVTYKINVLVKEFIVEIEVVILLEPDPELLGTLVEENDATVLGVCIVLGVTVML